MLISYLWMKDLVEFDLSPEELAAALTQLGLETSLADDRRGWYANMVTGKIVEAVPHPNADKLKLCKVDAGGGQPLSIVCGAPNAAAGMDVAVALVGARMPNGMKIEKRKVRGEVSEGMMASEAELELSDDHDGILALDDSPAPGTPLAERYELCDTILEVDLTPNRGDCLSMIGVAREVAAATGGALKLPDASVAEGDGAAADHLSVTIDAPDLCPRYAGRVIKNLSVKPSPFWMRRRLRALGVRAINNLVDVTNYVLMETGHPLHAFDCSMIAGNKIVVRRAADGERFTTLDGKEHELDPGNLVIADAERAVALAGVMGGQNSEVKDSTTDVTLEAAFFDPACVRRTAKGLNIKTESSFRFERGCDVEGLIYAQDRAARLMAELGGGAALRGRVDEYPGKKDKRRVTVRYGRVDAIMGASVGADKVKKILTALQMNQVDADEESVTVEAPYFRFDIEREIDLIEEVARFFGYDNVASAAPEVPANTSGMSRGYASRRALRRHLRSLGMMEGMRYSFINESDMDKMRLPEGDALRRAVKIDNPLTSDWTHLRTSLVPGLVSAAAGVDDARIFEIGAVFGDRGGDAPEERWMAAGIITETVRPGLWSGRGARRDFYDVKGLVESAIAFLGVKDYAFRQSSHPFYYPKRQAEVVVNGKAAGSFGQIHPETLAGYGAGQELFVFELDLGAVLAGDGAVRMVKQISKFPPVKRDLAVVVDEAVTAEALAASIRASGGGPVREVTLFDVYSGDKIGPGKKSVAFSLAFGDDERTLTDEEANALFEAILAGLKELGAELR